MRPIRVQLNLSWTLCVLGLVTLLVFEDLHVGWWFSTSLLTCFSREAGLTMQTNKALGTQVCSTCWFLLPVTEVQHYSKPGIFPPHSEPKTSPSGLKWSALQEGLVIKWKSGEGLTAPRFIPQFGLRTTDAPVELLSLPNHLASDKHRRPGWVSLCQAIKTFPRTLTSTGSAHSQGKPLKLLQMSKLLLLNESTLIEGTFSALQRLAQTCLNQHSPWLTPF